MTALNDSSSWSVETQSYTWNADTLLLSEVMEELDQDDVITHTEGKTGIGESNAELNFILQLIRFCNKVNEEGQGQEQVSDKIKVLYCGTHAHLVAVVEPYFPKLDISYCNDKELNNWEIYRGWVLIYDYQVIYADILRVCLDKRGLTVADNTGAYAKMYNQAIDEAMLYHMEAVARSLQQQQVINSALQPSMALWRFTLPRNINNLTYMEGEIWPSVWGASETNYAWLFTRGSDKLKVYSSVHFHVALKYYNIVLRRRFYINPITNDGQPPDYPDLTNSWDSWATVYILAMLDRTDADKIIKAHPPTTPVAGILINDPFM